MGGLKAADKKGGPTAAATPAGSAAAGSTMVSGSRSRSTSAALAGRPRAEAQTKEQDDDKDLYTHRPGLDAALTLSFVLLNALIVYDISARPADHEPSQLLGELALYVVAVAAVYTSSSFVFGLLYRLVATTEAASKGRNARKFSDQAWQLAIHSFMTLYGLWLCDPAGPVGLADAWENTTLAYVGPGGAYGVRANPWLERLYLGQAAVWLFTGFSHRWLEARHKDYYVMWGHHVCTIALLALSWRINLKFGAMVLLVHDASDILIDLLKMCNYAGLGSESGLYITEVVMALALVVWIYMRLWVFPTKLLPCAYFESGPVCDPHTFDNCLIMRGSLTLLQLMHVWWTYLLLRVVYRSLSSNDVHAAAREVYEGASDDSEDDERAESAKKDN